MPIFPKLTLKDKRLRAMVPRLRRKIERLCVRELIDRDPDYRATVKELVELCHFPRACGEPACARAQTCAHEAHVHEARARRRARAAAKRAERVVERRQRR